MGGRAVRIETAKTAGFCFGVRRAVELVEREAERSNGEFPVCTLGPIIHNETVIRRLGEKGVSVIQAPGEAPQNATVIIRAHGVPLSVTRELSRLGLRYIDATCPFVAKVHKIVAQEPPETVVLVAGDPGHPEVQGITGHCSGPFLVVQTGAELEKKVSALENFNKCPFILVAQTTFNRQEWEKTVFSAKKVCTNLKIFDTICKATVVRQEEAGELASRVDAMVVIGGRHSSNTRKLCSICSASCPTALVEEAGELARYRELFSQASLIGITAGASTPVGIIKEVQETMSRMDNISNDMTFEEMLDQSFKSTYNGEKVTGVVTGIKPNEIFVDIGTKHAGFVPMSELTDDPSAKPEDLVKVGDEIELLVVRVNDVEGTAMCSKKRLDQAAGFEKVMSAGETGEVLTGIVTEVIKGGVLVLSNGIKVFVPASQSGVPRDGDLNVLLRKEVSFKILETNRQRRRALGSISAVLRAQREELAKKFWEEVEIGKVYTGTVKSITNFSVFVDLGGVDGRVGMTDLTWLRVKHPSEVVKVGDVVTVTVKDINTEDKKVSLIYKKSEDNPWEVIKTQHQVGDVVTVKIMSITAFGAFAQIIPGIDGLIHISQIAKERVEKVADKLAVGDVVEAKITELDYEKKRASLSIKALLADREAAEEAENAAAAVEEVEE
ncbi:MAG: bifunctional 4-hydroxy-3-methylbut-2-enyl diphosphate reductase/30S ribosomal protein S1 [Angelakisella sp.]|jgi:4-hydroxy-3-methylbut-2-enyl diphosphate reductase|nr:bifunctional 4-hydroxy-3-methylbut-2-enyl diphosphate reductase/30S ribosomal protein S1 [Angelakisella sp.]